MNWWLGLGIELLGLVTGSERNILHSLSSTEPKSSISKPADDTEWISPIDWRQNLLFLLQTTSIHTDQIEVVNGGIDAAAAVWLFSPAKEERLRMLTVWRSSYARYELRYELRKWKYSVCRGQFIGLPQTFVELQLRFKLHFYTRKMQFEM